MRHTVFATFFILATISCMSLPAEVLCFGFGAAATGGSGELKADNNSLWVNSDPVTRYDQTRFALGFIYDTNVIQDKIFNYRLGVSYEHMNARAPGKGFSLKGMSVQNDFGFSLIRDENTRLWVGPEVKVEFLEGTETVQGYAYHEDVFSVGIGPVAGVNYRLNEDLFIAFKFGFLFQNGFRLFSEWEERYGFISFGLIQSLGGETKPARKTP